MDYHYSPSVCIPAEETDFEISHSRNFLTSIALILDRVIWHTVTYQSSTSVYRPNFPLKSEKLFVDKRMYGRMLRPALLIRSTRRSQVKNLISEERFKIHRCGIQIVMLSVTKTSFDNNWSRRTKPKPLAATTRLLTRCKWTLYRSSPVDRFNDEFLVAEGDVANFAPREANLRCQPEQASHMTIDST